MGREGVGVEIEGQALSSCQQPREPQAQTLATRGDLEALPSGFPVGPGWTSGLMIWQQVSSS